MELQIQKEKVKIKKKVGEKSKKMVIEKDIILPDNKPDIIRIQADYSNCYISKKEISENNLKIDGGIETRILYLTGEGKNRVFRVEEIFSEKFEIHGIKNDSCISDRLEIKSINITILNERKIHYKAEMECGIIVYTGEEIEFISKIDDESKIQTLKRGEVINQFISHAESKVSVKEKLEINSNEDIEVIKFNYGIKNIEKKISYNKILVKADCILCTIYQSESGTIKKIEKQTPLMGFLEVDGINEDDIIDINFTLQKLNIIENNNNIELELDLNMKGQIYQRKNIELITDLYDLNHSINFEKKKILVNNFENDKIYTFNKKILIEDINQLYDSTHEIKSVEKKDNNNIEIEMKSTFLYSSFENQEINRKDENFIVNYKYDEKIENPTIEIITSNVEILPDSNINIDLELKILESKLKEIELINEIHIEDEDSDDEFNMIIYFVKPGDSLWMIAKKFKSTISDIVRMNGIKDENVISVGEKLYIPRAV